MTDYPDWFSSTAKPNFEQFLLPLAGQENLKFLQIGAFTGDASLWMLQNVLTGGFNILIDVDTWEGSDEEAHKSLDFSDVHKVYMEKIKDYFHIVYPVTANSFNYLKSLDMSFDFIYIDGDHTTVGVLLDAELSWPHLKSGGIMAFDDYEWGESLPLSQRPKPAILLFTERHAGEFDTLIVNQQYWIRKK